MSGATGLGGDAELAPGTLAGGRYRIEALIGAGGMARVYRAFDTKALVALDRRSEAKQHLERVVLLWRDAPDAGEVAEALRLLEKK